MIGTTKLTLMAPGGGWTTTVALVCPRLSHQFLMSWVTQKKLQLLHPGWPFSRILGTNAASILEIQVTPKHLRPREQNSDPQTPIWPKPEWPQELKELCTEFSDMLVDELSQAQNIQCLPMDVELQAGAKPFFMRKLRKTPLHWGEKVKKEVKKLLKSGVIERISVNEAA